MATYPRGVSSAINVMPFTGWLVSLLFVITMTLAYSRHGGITGHVVISSIGNGGATRFTSPIRHIINGERVYYCCCHYWRYAWLLSRRQTLFINACHISVTIRHEKLGLTRQAPRTRLIQAVTHINTRLLPRRHQDTARYDCHISVLVCHDRKYTRVNNGMTMASWLSVVIT